ncbi:DUF3667 domain-containing protein [Christiangramia sabulilitoris]|uniref:DUF3667 domain-containing protein n=1 Tax=Christiangramia sabulilitoris TaxID=2583991 RepID=A0A550HZ91_9FLAO|nr:DUF3667 domain-containing protein [Christiangramia sabulilitoris]TRO64041.1 DUF3667 domain-containing protein [Christiangramia sabulilitoris]
MLEKYLKRDNLYEYRGTTCLNCQLPLEKSDHFCPNCGQKNSTKKLNFGDFFVEFFSGMFSYDSRFQRTIRVMLFSPGKISKDYVNGKRMRYANPFRFYLSASIIFFLISGISDKFEGAQFVNPETGIREGVAAIKQDSLLKNELNEIPALKKNNIQMDSLLNKIGPSEPEAKKTYKDIYLSQKELDTINIVARTAKKLNIFYRYYKETNTINPDDAITELEYENTGWNKWLYQKAMRYDLFDNNPQLFIDYFVNKLPFIIFFYLPVFALFIWLLYIRRSFNYMEHLIFAFHVQTTLFILYIIGYTIDYFLQSEWGYTLANFVFVFYLYKSMRNFYEQSRVKTILKFIILNIIFFTLATIATIIALIISFSIF